MACNAFPGRGSGLAGLRQAGPSGDDHHYCGGERGIRTPDTLAGTPDFESGAFSRSASSPDLTLHTSTAKPQAEIGTSGAERADTTLAERVGFEPTIRFRIHAFQACAFGRSATSPDTPTFFAGERTRVGARRTLPRGRRSRSRRGGSAWGRGRRRTGYRPHRPSDP